MTARLVGDMLDKVDKVDKVDARKASRTGANRATHINVAKDWPSCVVENRRCH
jgi:hypothetical protein